MKRFFSIIALLTLTANLLCGQEYDSPEYISLGREKARTKVVPYPTAEEAQALGAGMVASKFVRPVKEWTRTEEADAVVFTSKYVIPFVWLSRMAILYVDEASGAYEVIINGQKVGYSANAFAPAEFNVTKASKEDLNTISIRVLKDHPSRKLECFNDKTDARLTKIEKRSIVKVICKRDVRANWLFRRK